MSFLAIFRSLFGAIAFYTCLPVPHSWNLEFQYVGRWVTWIGLIIGGLLSLIDLGLSALGMPVLTRSALVIITGIGLTGGLHVDGAMDAADGLAVQNPDRRLEVMVDSATGAFGAIAAITIILLKTVSLAELNYPIWLALTTAAIWGRWGQMAAIAFYPYLKPTGKGAFHKAAIRVPIDLILGLLPIFALHGWGIGFQIESVQAAILASGVGMAIALSTGFYFHKQLGGHTGDTYGAVVEWTEALFLCCLTMFVSRR
ncbi:adenosylcobinamide-GDP ribazoletransferase [Merismopedia glauca]|uniref:Adenosylcobinamide-GDP ribazoletransferase n=1 Tax=Merismopedia glauca CCAP 1448/3 TaxID=1296344 RepID=A0A2T1BZI3_9CYAN|nr:adenosylcobinamide-GDP ribazoletransferase [Merismopedia glauca]PSB01327.1 adenosylcobinamide-GDP ribazoletransferase [Merismopedia glauca CCAP 1448/3]